MKNTRNKAIDFFRGLIAIQIIMIHTVFHSGSQYVPSSISNLTLLFDIPIFLVLSGMIYSLHENPSKKLKEIFKIISKWTIFVILCFIYLFIVDRPNVYFKDIPSWIVFRPATNSQYVKGLLHSINFMIYFIQSSILCSIIIYFVHKNKTNKVYITNLVYILILLIFILVSINSNISYFNLKPELISYSIFFLIGYLSMKYTFKNFKSFILIEIITILFLIIIMHFNNYNITNLQNLKPSNYIYVLTSFISTFLVIYLKDRFPFKHCIFKPIQFIGKNALYLYFAQGIGSSLLYFIVPKVIVKNLYLKIIIMFIINLTISLLIFFTLLLIYKLIDILIKRINKKLHFSLIKNIN